MSQELDYSEEEFIEDNEDDGIIEITPDINEDFDEITEDDILPCTYEDEADNNDLKNKTPNTASSLSGPTCTICNKSFSGRKHLYRHIRTVHERATETTCEICGRKLSDIDSCKRHMINVHKILVPNLSSASRSDLLAAEITASEPPAKRMAVSANLQHNTILKEALTPVETAASQLRRILPSTPVPIQDLKRDGFGPELNLPDTPPSPTESYSEEGPLILEQVVGVPAISHDPSMQSFECPDCNAIFKTKTALNFHRLKIHVMKGGTVKCPLCTEACLDLVAHMLRQHDGQYNGTVCPACGNTFSKRCTLNRHIEQVHLNIQIHKPATCPICEKVFSKKGHLDRHIKIIHNGIKDYSDPCPYCGKVFTTRASLEPHIAMVHDGVRRKCEICNKELSDLNKHMRTVHGEYRRKSKMSPSPTKSTSSLTSSSQLSPTFGKSVSVSPGGVVVPSFGKTLQVSPGFATNIKMASGLPSIHAVSSEPLDNVIKNLPTINSKIEYLQPTPEKDPDLADVLKKELGLGSVITLKRITKPSLPPVITASVIAGGVLLPKLSYHGPSAGNNGINNGDRLPKGVPSKFMMPVSVGSISLTPLSKS